MEKRSFKKKDQERNLQGTKKGTVRNGLRRTGGKVFGKKHDADEGGGSLH